MSAGADVLGQNVDSPATGQYAESQGIPWVGYDSNSSQFAPKSWLTAAVYNWGPYYLKRRRRRRWPARGSRASTTARSRTASPTLAPYGPGVSAKTKASIAAKLKAIETGTFYEFTGPLYDQAGKLRVAKGRT